MQQLQFITGLKIKRVFADLQTVHKFRRKPKREVQTFAGKNLQRSESARTRISTEDYGHVLVEFSNGARGMVCISQVSAGRKNHIVFEVNGTEKALWWDHERPNELMIGHRSQSNQLLLKDPSLLGPTARDYAHFPGGHNEGYPSALMNFCRNVYRYISKGGKKIDFATFEDGYNSMLVVESVIKSAKTEKWCTVGAK
jgi:predicted dehydrogenase